MRNHDPLDELRNTGHDDLADTIGAIRDRYRNQTPPSVGSQLSAIVHVSLTNDKGDLPVTAASNAYGPAPQASGPPHWRTTLTNGRHRTMQPIAAFLATVAGKVVLGTALAAASVGGVYAAGVDLPGVPDDDETTVIAAASDHDEKGASGDTGAAGSESTDIEDLEETDSDVTSEAACADDDEGDNDLDEGDTDEGDTEVDAAGVADDDDTVQAKDVEDTDSNDSDDTDDLDED